MTADVASASTRAAFLLRTVASDEHVSNQARLHCLYAAELLDPHTGMPATIGPPADAAAVIRDALRLLAALPADAVHRPGAHRQHPRPPGVVRTRLDS